MVAGGNKTSGPCVYVVVAVHNRKALTRNFCDCLSQQSYRHFVLVLVDDGSTDDTFQVVASYSFAKQIIRGDGSLWFAGGVRRGMARVLAQNPRQDDVVWFANDDTSFESNFLENALRELDSIGQGAMLAVPSVFTDSGNRSEGGFCCYWPKFTFKDYGLHPERIDCASTRCLLMRWEDARKTGGFRPRLLPQYLSDLDFTIRGHRRGIRIIPAASVCSLSTEYTTGLHRVPPGKAWEVIKYMFSNRFSANPLHVFIFILLAAPVFWKVTCWLFAAKSSFSFFINATVVKRLRGRSGQGN